MNQQLIYYVLTAAMVISAYLLWYRARDRHFRAIQRENIAAGLTEPASLHPIIDPIKCIGCGSCVAACPEQDSHPVLGIVGGKAVLVEPTSCIGHGACRAVCPVNAITLVFGTERRGVDIPPVSPDFETNIPGLFIAGELGGMGLIRNAIEQGIQAMSAIAKRNRASDASLLDVLIVGAGPAGIAASLRAHELGLSYQTIEQDSLGGSVFQFPRGKLVMTAPVELPIVGKVRFRETSKEALLELWTTIVDNAGLSINFKQSVTDIELIKNGFKVKTLTDHYETRHVLLAIGRRGTPRKLGVPGEELPKVVYRLLDPEQYRGCKVLVVGGGDSALEAAASIAEQPDTTVALSYRSGAFSRAKPKNRERIEKASEHGRVQVLFNSTVKSIGKLTVTLTHNDDEVELENNAVIVSAGGVLPTGFLQRIGVEVETKHGIA